MRRMAALQAGEQPQGIHRPEAGFCSQTLKRPCWNWPWDVFIAVE